ncbi:hypothetical protein GYMC10_2986 [Paenibacillus sp. Y412MC10]|nr:hypothetical protein GYMC10_2986 [Paenibacillus sp. Y412MC10]
MISEQLKQQALIDKKSEYGLALDHKRGTSIKAVPL